MDPTMTSGAGALAAAPFGAGPPRRFSNVALNGLLFIAAVVVLKLAKPLAAPVALSVVLFLMLTPLVTALVRLRVPRTAAAAAVAVFFFGTLGTAGTYFAEPATSWFNEIPELVPTIREKLVPVSKPIARIEEVAVEVGKLAELGAEQHSEKVKIEEGGVLNSMLFGALELIVTLGIVVFLTFFLLAFGETLHRRFARLGRTVGERRRLLLIGQLIQSNISQFMGVITLINMGLGGATACVFWLLGVPNYLLWGGVVAVANFVPYAGAAVMTVVFAAVGLISFDTLADAAAVPAAFLALTVLEGQVITPFLVGRRLDLSPLAVLAAVIFWGYMWGLIGALVAVPILASTRIVVSHVPSLKPLAALLSRDDPLPRVVSRAPAVSI